MKQTIILLHGALGYRGQFAGLESKLARKFRVLAFNFSGHGGAPQPEPPSISLYTDELKRFILEHRAQGCGLFGHSMGGYVALCLAAKEPGLVGKVFTLGTKMDWSPEVASREAQMLVPEKIKEKLPGFAGHLRNLHGDWETLALQVAGMLREMGAQPPLTDQLAAGISCPVRLGLGDRDKMVSPGETLRVFRLLQKGSLLVLPGTPHPYDTVNVERLYAECLDFFPDKAAKD